MIAKSLGDTKEECRTYGNLGSAYFSQGSYIEALTVPWYQLALATKFKGTQAAAAALTSLDHEILLSLFNDIFYLEIYLSCSDIAFCEDPDNTDRI